MPIYEYQCEACGHELEKLQKMHDAPLVDCPSCSEAELRKKISAAGFRLKGGGWYETDFKTGSQKNLAGNKAAAKDAKKEGGASTASSSTDKGAGKSTKSA